MLRPLFWISCTYKWFPALFITFGVFILETIKYGFVLLACKMENELIIGALGLIISYFIFKSLTRKQKTSTKVYSNILTNDKYKVKGQWDK